MHPESTERNKLIVLVNEYGRAVHEYALRMRNGDSLERARSELIAAIDGLLKRAQSDKPAT